jgi:hypothetical protein
MTNIRTKLTIATCSALLGMAWSGHSLPERAFATSELAASDTTLTAQQEPDPGLAIDEWKLCQVFTEVSLDVTEESWIPFTDDDKDTWTLPPSRGTAFLAKIGGTRGILTARHVLDSGRHYLDEDERERRFAVDGKVTILDSRGNEHDLDSDSRVTAVRTRVAVGPLAVRPNEVWFDRNLDLAFMPITNAQDLKALDTMSQPQDRAPLEPASRAPLKLGASRILAVGFAAGPLLTSIEGRLTDRTPDQLSVDANSPQGLSGSPAFHNDHFAGIVINSTANSASRPRFGVLDRAAIMEACKNTARWERVSIQADPVGFTRKP